MADEVLAPTVTTRPRTNGWNCPWHPLQVIAWSVVLLFTLAHYGFLIFYFPPNWIYLGGILPGVVFLVHVTASIVTTSINPAEPNVRMRQHGGGGRLEFDRSQHEHVIENLHCNICNTDVGMKAKHCRLCDKCVSGFDHHCKWLNTCVGDRNYKWFIATIVSALVGVVMMAIVCTSFFILFFAARDHLAFNCNVPGNTTACDPTLRILAIPIPDAVFPTVVGILGLLAVLGIFLLGHLTLFHFYLIYKGISTYDYIVEQRNEAPRESRCNTTELCSCSKRNRVSPASMEEGILDSDSSVDSNASRNSNNSAGMVTFGRTPPGSDDEDRQLPSSGPQQPNISLPDQSFATTATNVSFADNSFESHFEPNGIQLQPIAAPTGQSGGIVRDVSRVTVHSNISTNNNVSTAMQENGAQSSELTREEGKNDLKGKMDKKTEEKIGKESSLHSVDSSNNLPPLFFPRALSPINNVHNPSVRSPDNSAVSSGLFLSPPVSSSQSFSPRESQGSGHSSFTTSPFLHQALRPGEIKPPELQLADSDYLPDPRGGLPTYALSEIWHTSPHQLPPDVVVSSSSENVHIQWRRDAQPSSQSSSPRLAFVETPPEYAILSCTSTSLTDSSQPINTISQDNSVTVVRSQTVITHCTSPPSNKPKKVVSFTLASDAKAVDLDSVPRPPPPPPTSPPPPPPPPLPPLSDEPTWIPQTYTSTRPLPPLNISAPDNLSLGSHESLNSSSSVISLNSYSRRYSRRAQRLGSSLTSLDEQESKKKGTKSRERKQWSQNHADSLTELGLQKSSRSGLFPLSETRPTSDTDADL